MTHTGVVNVLQRNRTTILGDHRERVNELVVLTQVEEPRPEAEGVPVVIGEVHECFT